MCFSQAGDFAAGNPAKPRQCKKLKESHFAKHITFKFVIDCRALRQNGDFYGKYKRIWLLPPPGNAKYV